MKDVKAISLFLSVSQQRSLTSRAEPWELLRNHIPVAKEAAFFSW
jgi:hypothetical protein